MAHFAYKKCHSRFLRIKINIKFHIIALSIKRFNILFNFVRGYSEVRKLPLYTHKETAIYLVYILVKIDDIAMIVRNKFCYLCDDAQFVRAV